MFMHKRGLKTVSGHVIMHLLALSFALLLEQEAQLPQRDRATRCVSKLVLCFTKYGS